MKNLAARISLVSAVACATLVGCASTEYTSTAKDPASNVVITRTLKARTFLVNREIGTVKIGEDSLAGAKSDSTTAIEALTAIAARQTTGGLR